MKKFLTLIAFAMTIGMVACSDDDCDHQITNDDDSEVSVSLVGSWYEESENEEVRYNETGTYYDVLSNYVRCAETEGRWEFDSKNSKLTETYTFLGHSNSESFTVKDLSELSFTISSSTNGAHTYEKIVESYNMNVGETVTIEFPRLYPNYSVISYSSNNERIASVTSDGVIKAEGEKGYTYIKVKTATNTVWVKVTVGDNNADLWYDYVGLIGLDYSGVTNALSSLGDSAPGENGYSFGYLQSTHDVIEILMFVLCKEDGTTTDILLKLKEDTPEAEILSYMNSRYYKMQTSDQYIYYSSVEDTESSKAIIVYDKTNKQVVFKETQHFLHYPHVKDLWTDFTGLFGNNKDQVKSAMDGYGYSFLMSDSSYSKDGADYYNITGNSYAQMAAFIFNPDKLVSEFWVYLNSTSNNNDIYTYLCAKYTENSSESSQYESIFYNEDKSIKVAFNREYSAVIYTNLTMKQHTGPEEILGTYYEGLGMTRDQILSQYGTPYTESGNILYYLGETNNVSFACFSIDSETGICKSSQVFINENVDNSTIVNFLGSQYTVYANGTADDGSQYAWINASTFSEATMGIIYYVKSKTVNYVLLSSSSRAKSINNFGIDERAIRNIASAKASLLKDRMKINKFRKN